MKPHEVAIVVDPGFGEQLVPLAEQMHVWAVESAANRAVYERLWRASGIGNYSSERGVSSFKVQPTDGAFAAFENVLDLVESHHGHYSHEPPWTVLHCYGVPPETVLLLLMAFGVDQVSKELDHFVATRPEESARHPIAED
jgi:hypothetical protein